jgi:hypothetical protein
MDFGIASVAAITVIAYLIGAACKASAKVPDTWIPVICGSVGALLGIAGLYLMPDFPATDIVNALAVGIVSGFAATGINQIYKQATKERALRGGDPSISGACPHTRQSPSDGNKSGGLFFLRRNESCRSKESIFQNGREPLTFRR